MVLVSTLRNQNKQPCGIIVYFAKPCATVRYIYLVQLAVRSTIHPIKVYRSFYGTYANGANLGQTLQNAASDQGLHCFLTETFNKV